MSLEHLNNNISQFSNLQVTAKRVNVPENAKREPTERIFSPTKYDETKSLLISEQLDDVKNSQLNEIRFQSGTPIAKLLSTVKPFNETELVKKADAPKSESKKINVHDDSDEKETEEESSSGFYLVANQMKPNTSKLLPGSKHDIIRERLSIIYNAKPKKENGSLVNLTF